MPKNDEVLIRLRDGMTDDEVNEQLATVSKVLHRIIQLSISVNALVNRPFMAHLINGAGMIQNACDVYEQNKMAQQQQFALAAQAGRRPQ